MENQDTAASPELQEEELSHSDKMIGVFSEPTATFEKTAKFPPKTMDWFLPILLLAVLISVQQILYHANPEISFQLKQKQMEAIGKRLDAQVESGAITRDQANQQRDMIESRMDQMGGVALVFQTIGIWIAIFVVFFIMAGIYFLLVKFALKGEGGYSSVMVASGLSAYIGVLGIIITTIISLLMGKLFMDSSVASFMGSDKSTIVGWVLAKLDIFTIWSFVVFAIGLAKMFKSSSTQKYYMLVFGVWLIGGLILFFLAKAIPFLKFFGM
ncbi:MAG: YIP1 family protein [Ignavibacteriaceae bacterium]